MRLPIIALLLLASMSSNAQSKFQKDFDFYWNTVNDNFAYFDKQKTNWNKVKEIYQPIADTITTTRSFVEFLENVNNELYNGHISLNTNLPSSNRLIPTGADLWVIYKNKQFIITAVREGFNAEKSGLKPGLIIKSYNGKPIESAIQQFLPKSVTSFDERMYEFAGNMLLAGTHDTKRTITALDKGIEKTFHPDDLPLSISNSPIIEYKKLPGGNGYIKINNSLGNNDLIQAFDNALDSLWNTKGLILDLRETPSGGNTTVARAIMGRFITKELPYQKHSLPNEEKRFGTKRSWIEIVSPRKKTYTKPLVVLVNRWTGSMGEGMAIGFDALKRATVIGDKMAGLLGAIYTYRLPETNISFSIPVEKLFHINGTPREEYRPQVIIKNNKDYINTAIDVLRKTLVNKN